MNSTSKKLIDALKITIIALALTVGVNYLFAWVGAPSGGPTSCPPGHVGCDAPINVGTSAQTKNGQLTVTNLWGTFVGSTAGGYFATKLGIGPNASTSGSATLDVDGTIRIRGGNPVNGNVLTSDANGNASWQSASSTSGEVNYVEFVGFSTTWTVPVGTKKIKVKAWGAGGGGGAGDATDNSGGAGGGGAGGYAEATITNPASSYSISAGVGGRGAMSCGNGTGQAGGNGGGASAFMGTGITLLANQGLGGGGKNGAGGLGGTASGGSVNLTGGAGGAHIGDAGGAGGSNANFAGGAGARGTTAGTINDAYPYSGRGFGSGGGGGGGVYQVACTGGDGADGKVAIWYW